MVEVCSSSKLYRLIGAEIHHISIRLIVSGNQNLQDYTCQLRVRLDCM